MSGKTPLATQQDGLEGTYGAVVDRPGICRIESDRGRGEAPGLAQLSLSAVPPRGDCPSAPALSRCAGSGPLNLPHSRLPSPDLSCCASSFLRRFTSVSVDTSLIMTMLPAQPANLYPEVPPPGEDKLSDEKISLSSKEDSHHVESGRLTSWEGVSFTPADVSSLFPLDLGLCADDLHQTKRAGIKIDLILISTLTLYCASLAGSSHGLELETLTCSNSAHT